MTCVCVSHLGTAPARCQAWESRAGGPSGKAFPAQHWSHPPWLQDNVKPHGKWGDPADKLLYRYPSMLSQRGAADEGLIHHQNTLGTTGCSRESQQAAGIPICSCSVLASYSSGKAVCKWLILFTLRTCRHWPCCRHRPTALVCSTAAVEKCLFNSGSAESHWKVNLHCDVTCNTPVLGHPTCVSPCIWFVC